MSASVLVATPHAAFGELIRISLEEQGSYRVRLVLTAKEARASFAKADYQVAIFDSDLEDEPFVPLSKAYLAQSERNRIVVIPPNNNPTHPALAGLNAHGYLSKPFYLPDLLEMVNRLVTSEKTILAQPEPEEADQPVARPKTALPPLLTEPVVLKNFLENQLSATTAIAAMVAHNQDIYAYAGALTQPNTQDLLALIQRYWDLKDKTDLMRFVRISGLPGDYLIYVTEIETSDAQADYVLMMIFEPRTSINQVRPQTRQMAQNLATQPIPLSSTQPTLIGNKNGIEKKSKVETTGNVIIYETPPSAIPPAENMPTQPIYPVEPHAFEDEGTEEVVDKFDLSVLLGAIPSPDPTPGKPAEPVAESTLPPNQWLPASQSEPQRKEPELMPPPVDLLDLRTGNLADLTAESQISSLEDTRPRIVHAITSINQLEPISPALSLLNYTCVLIPRLPQHYLTGELADRLSQWVQQYCLAFAWRLEGISIRPEYLQWTVQVAPSVSPSDLIHVIRQRTSNSFCRPISAYGLSGKS